MALARVSPLEGHDHNVFVLCVLQVGGKDNPALDPIIHGLRGVVHHGECC